MEVADNSFLHWRRRLLEHDMPLWMYHKNGTFAKNRLKMSCGKNPIESFENEIIIMHTSPKVSLLEARDVNGIGINEKRR